MKTIFGENIAIEFAAAHNITISKWDSQSTKEELSRLYSFNIPGFSTLEVMFIFSEYDGAWSYRYQQIVLRINETGEYFEVTPSYKKRDKYELRMARRDYKKTYTYNEKEPNAIGVATKKKILDWVNFVRKYHAFQIQTYTDALEKNREFAKKFQTKYPDGDFYFDSTTGWCSYFRIKTGSLVFSYSAIDTGSFSRSIAVNYLNIPTNEDLLK